MSWVSWGKSQLQESQLQENTITRKPQKSLGEHWTEVSSSCCGEANDIPSSDGESHSGN